jgi:hypothetical protein
VDEANLDPIEKAIRAALEKGNPEDGSFRQKIYRSAEMALTRSLSARQGMDEASKKARLTHLSQVVAYIETEFAPAVAPVVKSEQRADLGYASPVNAPVNAKPAPRAQEPRFESAPQAPRVAPSNAGHGDTDRQIRSYDRAGAPDHRIDAELEEKRTGSLFRKLVTTFVLITIFALLIMFGWTAWNSSLFGNGVDNGSGPAKLSQSENSADGGLQQVGNGVAADENWIDVFAPKDVASVQASDGVVAELRGSGAGAYLNLANKADTAQGEATFDIGRGVLESLRGKKIVFNVQAKTTDGTSTQMATSCSLAGMGECQRVRFRLEGQLSENLVIVQLSDTAPEASGTLTIMPDIDKTGNPVEIVSIRVRAEQ